MNYSKILGWGRSLNTDFYVPKSPIFIPNPQTTGVQTVAKFAAGFSKVGLSVAHANWLTLLIANDGQDKCLNYFLLI